MSIDSLLSEMVYKVESEVWGPLDWNVIRWDECQAVFDRAWRRLPSGIRCPSLRLNPALRGLSVYNLADHSIHVGLDMQSMPTVLHEAAHAATAELYGPQPLSHSPEWIELYTHLVREESGAEDAAILHGSLTEALSLARRFSKKS